jgi:ribose/xylose/arabinose/galactoside ABC-type transport system permease subunit
MVVVLSLASSQFLTVPNLRNILLQISVNLCLSIGMTLVILTGGIDLSVGAVLGLAGAVAAGLLKFGLTLKLLGVQVQFTPFGAVVAGILVGISLGWFNGLAITRFKLPPFVATLGMLSIGRGPDDALDERFPHHSSWTDVWVHRSGLLVGCADGDLDFRGARRRVLPGFDPLDVGPLHLRRGRE